MAISFTRYVDITSGVGGGNVVAQRQLIGRLFTTNPLLPTGSVKEFTSATDVGAYFGTTSEEYLRAAFYFGWVSKNITRPSTISFSRWVNAAVPPRIFGAKFTTTLAQFQAITNGAFSMTLGGVTNVISGLNFSSVGAFAGVATMIQGAINSQSGSQWTGATVTYNATRGSFDFVGGNAVAANIVVAPPGVGTDITSLIGWVPPAIFSNGSLVETITQTLTNSAALTNNFGSFLFLPSLTIDQIVEAATWNETQNVLYQYCVPVSATNASSWSAALIGFAGLSLTLSITSGEYPEQVPMMILAATNYNARNSVQNYMFQQFNLTPSVNTDTDANFYDPLRVNYYGQTQTAGQFIQFYQRGILMGLATDPVDMNVYANEQWLKDAAAASIMTLLLSLAKISANVKGQNQILSILQSVIDAALNNGTISVGKTLTTSQILFITEITGDPNAWQQIQTIGYWVTCVIESFTTVDNRVEFKAVYTLVYSKDDVIRKVEGTHILI